MNESDLSYKIQQKLADFDNIGSIQPTEAWRLSLSSKLSSRRNRKVNTRIPGFLLAVIFLIIINLGFILSSVIRNSSINNHVSDLQVISSQLLINQSTY
jgi:hypothetical protein